MNDYFYELEVMGAYVDAQPEPVRQAFLYCLALILVESGGARLARTIPGDKGTICEFVTNEGEALAIARPALSEEQEAVIVEALREMLREEGLV